MAHSYKRALVTGANGFVGAALTKRLLAEGIAVRAICRDPANGRFLTGAEVVGGDVQDAEAMRRYAQGCEVIFHVAAIGSASANVAYRINVQGAENMARAAAEANAARFVHISTVGIYGTQLYGSVFESQPPRSSPRDFYGQSKALGEAAIWRIAAQTGLSATMVRPAFIYGPRSVIWTRALYELCRRLPAVPNFPGLAHPIFVADLVDLMLVMAEHPNAPGEVFHASADPAIPWPEFIGYYAAMAGKSRKITVSAAALDVLSLLVRPLENARRLTGSPIDISGTLRYAASEVVYRMDKAANRLDWQPRTSLAEGMAACERWLLAVSSQA